MRWAFAFILAGSLVGACGDSGSGAVPPSTTPEFTVVSRGNDAAGCYVRYLAFGEQQEWRGVGADCSDNPGDVAVCLGRSIIVAEAARQAACDRWDNGAPISVACFGLARVGDLLPSPCR